MHSNRELRRRLWGALKKDDAKDLVCILEAESKERDITMRELVGSLVHILWKDDGAHRDGRERGIICVTASNTRGIDNDEGAIQCLRAILSMFPPDDDLVCSRYQVKFAYYSALKLNRVRAVEALREHAMYHGVDVDQSM